MRTLVAFANPYHCWVGVSYCRLSYVICCLSSLSFYSKSVPYRLTVGLILLLRGEDLNDHCSWCHYLSCVPTSRWSCNTQPMSCQVKNNSLTTFSHIPHLNRARFSITFSFVHLLRRACKLCRFSKLGASIH